MCAPNRAAGLTKTQSSVAGVAGRSSLEVPVRVVYGLTEAGRTLCEPLRALQEWSIAHLGDVAASQEAYDRAD